MAVGLLAVGATVAACSSRPSSPTAAGGSTTTTHAKTTTTDGGSSTGGGTQGSGLLAYSSCMRSKGIPDFPDPTSSGGIPKETPQQLGVSQSQFDTAQNTCQHLIPAGETPSGQKFQTITTQQQQDYLKAAACMRSHGIPSFPEPVFTNSIVEFPMLQHLVDLNSTQFKQAYDICKNDIPPGLPGNGAPLP